MADNNIKAKPKNLLEWFTFISMKTIDVIFISVCAVIIFSAFSATKQEYPSALAVFPFMLSAITVFAAAILSAKNKKTHKNKRLWIYIVSCICAALTLVIAYCLLVNVSHTWDYGQLIRSAHSIALSGTLDNVKYYARYPNNALFLMILSNYFKLISRLFPNREMFTYIASTVPLNCLFVILSVLFTCKSAMLIFGQKHRLSAFILTLSFSPLYVYCAIAYTDTFGILPVALCLYLYLLSRTKQAKTRYLLLLIAGIVCGFGFEMKAPVIILAIAVSADIILSVRKGRITERVIRLSVFLLSLILSIVLISNVTSGFLNSLGVDESARDAHEFPTVHWIMMSLNTEGSGGYIQDDVDFTMSFPDKQSKSEADKAEISKRVEEMGMSGLLKHVFSTKAQRTWGDGTIASSYYANREPLSDNIIRKIVCGGNTSPYRTIAQSYWLCILSLMLIYSLAGIFSSKEDKRSLILKIVIVGVFLFFSIWECNSRYLFIFMPAILLCAALGFVLVGAFCNVLVRRYSQKTKTRRHHF